jgi:hypothetical protein
VATNYEKIIKENLSKLFSQPPSRLHRSLGAERSGESLLLRAFGQDCSIDHEKVSLSRSEGIDLKGLLVSLYALHANPEQLQLEPFKSFKDFSGSMPYQGAFSANSERTLVPYVPLIKENKEEIKAIFDGEDGHDEDFSLILYPLPKIPLYYIFYLPDDDFPASVTALFCANALSFMPLDGLADVAEYTSKEIIQLVKK